MEFIKPSLDKIDEIRKYLEGNKNRSCDYTPASLIMWSDYFRFRYTIINECFVIVMMKGERFSEDGELLPEEAEAFSYPLGPMEYRNVALDMILDYFEQHDTEPVIMMINHEQEKELEGWYPGVFEVEYDRGNADYIYQKDKLRSLAGSKLHAKRNHINKFMELYPDYVTEPITAENKEYCMRLEDNWNKALAEEDELRIEKDGEAAYEECAISYALEHMEELGLEGIAIKIPYPENPDEFKYIAFTIGEPLTDDCYVVHFEKAISAVQGSFAMINHEFVKRYMDDYTYVNREEDMGLEGLRKSKLSYHPYMFYEKGIARKK